jgi:hypothetical protein
VGGTKERNIMVIVERILEMRGRPRIEFINYFISIDGENIGDEKFVGHNWEVELSEESLINIGSLKLPSTKVLFRCDKEIIEQMIFAFNLRFLSAGG